MSVYYQCIDNTCQSYLQPVYTQRGSIFSHYAKKGINILVLTAYHNDIIANPFEDHRSLIWKLCEKSKVSGV